MDHTDCRPFSNMKDDFLAKDHLLYQTYFCIGLFEAVKYDTFGATAPEVQGACNYVSYCLTKTTNMLEYCYRCGFTKPPQAITKDNVKEVMKAVYLALPLKQIMPKGEKIPSVQQLDDTATYLIEEAFPVLQASGGLERMDRTYYELTPLGLKCAKLWYDYVTQETK